ncbi:MAG: hypothetical protein ACRDK4_12145 [Solirubrobacteraceae bacterium]
MNVSIAIVGRPSVNTARFCSTTSRRKRSTTGPSNPGSESSDEDKRRLGVTCAFQDGPHELTYRQIEYTFARVVRALSKQKPDGEPSQILSEVIDSLLQGSVTVLGVPDSTALALDWSDYESFARPPLKPREKNEAQQDEREGEQEEAQQEEKADLADPEASWGYRKVNHPGKSESFFGYYVQAATIVKDEGGPEAPELVRRITLASCKHDPPAQIVPVIKRMAGQRTELGDLTVDSGYSYRQPETFATPMRAAGAKLVMDIHPNDRGMKGTPSRRDHRQRQPLLPGHTKDAL